MQRSINTVPRKGRVYVTAEQECKPLQIQCCTTLFYHLPTLPAAKASMAAMLQCFLRSFAHAGCRTLLLFKANLAQPWWIGRKQTYIFRLRYELSGHCEMQLSLDAFLRRLELLRSLLFLFCSVELITRPRDRPVAHVYCTASFTLP
jgi:hypothetical protein